MIDSLIPETPDLNNLPETILGYLIHVSAQFLVDNQVMFDTGQFTVGQELASTLEMTRLTGGRHVANNAIVAGEEKVIAINLQGISDKQLLNTLNNQPSNVFPSIAKSYYATIDNFYDVQEALGLAIVVPHPSAGLISTTLTPHYYFGIPRDVNITGVGVDMDIMTQSAVSMSAEPQDTFEVVKNIGLIASTLEHEIPPLFMSNNDYPTASVSSMRALALALVDGQRLYSISQSNLSTVLPQLNVSAEVKADIQSAAFAGQEILTSQNQISAGNWSGVGYIITDPVTGSSAYRISGGTNGGETDGGFGNALSLVGLGALSGFLLPDAFSNTPDDCDEDGDTRNIKVSWAEQLFFAIFMLLLITAILLTPGVREAFAALLVFFLGINTAKAEEPGCFTFVSGHTSKRGVDVDQVTSHIAVAIAAGSPEVVTWRGRGKSAPRHWLRSNPLCDDDARRNYRNDHPGIEPECDEYPFASVYEGGEINFGSPPGYVSLRLLDEQHNSSHGGSWGAFLDSCKVRQNERIKIEISSGVVSGRDKQGNICY